MSNSSIPGFDLWTLFVQLGINHWKEQQWLNMEFMTSARTRKMSEVKKGRTRGVVPSWWCSLYSVVLIWQFGTNNWTKLAFVVTKFPQMLRAKRDYKPVQSRVHAEYIVSLDLKAYFTDNTNACRPSNSFANWLFHAL